jgi:hypothetical protein
MFLFNWTNITCSLHTNQTISLNEQKPPEEISLCMQSFSFCSSFASIARIKHKCLFVIENILVEWQYSETLVHERPCSRTNFPSKKRLRWRTVSRITNTKTDNSGKLRVSARKCQLLVNFVSVHTPACIRRAFPWICVLFFLILLNKTPWDQRRIMIAKLNEVFVYILSV